MTEDEWKSRMIQMRDYLRAVRDRDSGGPSNKKIRPEWMSEQNFKYMKRQASKYALEEDREGGTKLMFKKKGKINGVCVFLSINLSNLFCVSFCQSVNGLNIAFCLNSIH